MSFAERYIARNIIFPDFIEQPVSERLGMVVVVPVYNEPGSFENS